MLQLFDWLADFHMELLQAISFVWCVSDNLATSVPVPTL
jgi:hypothetical protein